MFSRPIVYVSSAFFGNTKNTIFENRRIVTVIRYCAPIKSVIASFFVVIHCFRSVGKILKFSHAQNIGNGSARTRSYNDGGFV